MNWGKSLVFLLSGAFLVGGCTSVEEGVKESSIGSVVTGETTDVEGFFERVRRQNQEDRDQKERNRNRDTVRAYNLKTGKYEFVPSDSLQRWNEEERRWEFHPE